jgi:hypothetical protein
MAPDPADVARERAERIQTLLEQAERFELVAAQFDAQDQPDLMLRSLTYANQNRLKAICEHLNLRVREEGDDGESG